MSQITVTLSIRREDAWQERTPSVNSAAQTKKGLKEWVYAELADAALAKVERAPVYGRHPSVDGPVPPPEWRMARLGVEEAAFRQACACHHLIAEAAAAQRALSGDIGTRMTVVELAAKHPRLVVGRHQGSRLDYDIFTGARLAPYLEEPDEWDILPLESLQGTRDDRPPLLLWRSVDGHHLIPRIIQCTVHYALDHRDFATSPGHENEGVAAGAEVYCLVPTAEPEPYETVRHVIRRVPYPGRPGMYIGRARRGHLRLATALPPHIALDGDLDAVMMSFVASEYGGVTASKFWGISPSWPVFVGDPDAVEAWRAATARAADADYHLDMCGA